MTVPRFAQILPWLLLAAWSLVAADETRSNHESDAKPETTPKACSYGIAKIGTLKKDPEGEGKDGAKYCRQLLVPSRPAADACPGKTEIENPVWEPWQVHAVKYVPRPIGVTRESDVYTPPYKFIYERDLMAMSSAQRANAVRLDPWDIKADHSSFLTVCQNQGISVIPTFDLTQYLESKTPISDGALRQQLGKDFEEFLAQAENLKDKGDHGPIVAWSLNYALEVAPEVKLGPLSRNLESQKRKSFFSALCYLRHVHKKKEWDSDKQSYKRPLAIPLNLNSAATLQDIGWFVAFAESEWGSWPDCPYWENSPTTLEKDRGVLRQLGSFDIWILEGMYLAKEGSRVLALNQAAQVNASTEVTNSEGEVIPAQEVWPDILRRTDEDAVGPSVCKAVPPPAPKNDKDGKNGRLLLQEGDEEGELLLPNNKDEDPGPEDDDGKGTATSNTGSEGADSKAKPSPAPSPGPAPAPSPGPCLYPTRKAVIMQFGISSRVTSIGPEGTIEVQADAGEQMEQLQTFWSQLNKNLQTDKNMGGSCVSGGILDEWMDDWDRSSSLDCDSNPYEHSLDQRCTVDPGQGQLYPEWLGINAQYSSYGLQCIAPRAPHKKDEQGKTTGGRWFCFTKDDKTSIPDDLCDFDFASMSQWMVTKEKLIPWPQACRFYGVQVPLAGWTIPMTWALSVWTLIICMLPACRGWWNGGCCSRKASKTKPRVSNPTATPDAKTGASMAPPEKELVAVTVEVPHLVQSDKVPKHFSFRLEYLPVRKSKQGIKQLSKELAETHLRLHVETQERRLWQQIEAEAWAVQSRPPTDKPAEVVHGVATVVDIRKSYQMAMSHIHARCLEGYIVWLEENSKKSHINKPHFHQELLDLTNTDPSTPDPPARPSGYLYIDALLLRVVESLAEQALHAPEYICWQYHQIREPTWLKQSQNQNQDPEAGEARIYTIQYDKLHEGIEKICENPDPYSGGLNFDDINDCAHYAKDTLTLKKVFHESPSVLVLIDCFSNFQAVFTLKSWVLYAAWLLWHWISKNKGTNIEVEWEDIIFTITFVDSLVVSVGEALTMMLGIRQGRFRTWHFARARWATRHIFCFLNGCVGIVCCLNGAEDARKVAPFYPADKASVVGTSLLWSYWGLRLLLCMLFWFGNLGYGFGCGRYTPHRPGRPEGRGGGKSLKLAKTSRWSRAGVWALMLFMCLVFETFLVAPLAYGIRFKDFCKDSCYQVVGSGERGEKRFDEFLTSSCLSCSGALGMVWVIVVLTSFFDIYYMFYLGTALVGYFEGHNAGLTNILQSAHRRLDLNLFKQKDADEEKATENESDAALMRTLFGPSWRRVWSKLAESLHEENMISSADANLMVKNAGTTRWKDFADPAMRAKMVLPEDCFEQVTFTPIARHGGNMNETSVIKCISGIKVVDDSGEEQLFEPRSFAEEVDGAITVKLRRPCKLTRFSFKTASTPGSDEQDPTQFRLEGQTETGVLHLLVLENGPVDPTFSEDGTPSTASTWRPTDLRDTWEEFTELKDHEEIIAVRFTPRTRRLYGQPCIGHLCIQGCHKDNPDHMQTDASSPAQWHVAPDGTITHRLPCPQTITKFSFVGTDNSSMDPTQWALKARTDAGEWKELHLQTALYVPGDREEEFTVEFWRIAGPEGLGKSMALEELRGNGALERLTFWLSTLETLALEAKADEEGLLSGPHGAIPSMTQILPCYNETVILDAKTLRDSDGVNTNLAFIISQYKYEWRIFCERQKRSLEELYDDFINHSPTDKRISDQMEMEVQMWASMRSQTVARTVVGAMRYHEVLDLIPSLRDPMEEYKGPIREEEFRGRHACLAQLIVAHQTFGKLKTKGGDPANDKAIIHLLELYKKYPIYVVFDYDAGGAQDDVKKMVTAKVGGNLKVQYASVMARFRRGHHPMMVEEVRNLYKDIELVEVLPRCYPLRIGEKNFQTQGKAGNQLGALRFSAGHYLQMMDCNMGAFFGEAAKVPFVLRKFQPVKQGVQDRYTVAFRILGFRELIFTKDHGAMGGIMAAAEWSFGTICQRFLAGLDARMHYGHPDFIDGFWASNRGSLSKASPVINLSEDIFAGFNARMRGERSSHTDALAWEKGREASFNASSDFFRKVSCGNVGVMRSRDLKILTDRLSLVDNLSFYFASIGFYLNNWLIDISMTVYVLLFVLLAFASKDLDSVGQLGSMLAVEWVISMGTVSMLPRLAELVLEYGYFEGLIHFIPSVPGIMLAFTFINKSIAAGVGEAMVTGQASYISTGRPNANTHYSWRDCYFSHSATHYYPAMFIIFLFGLYTAISAERGTASLPMFVILGTASLWLIAPLLFCPQPTLKSMKRDGREFWKFIVAAPALRQSMRFHKLNKSLEETLVTKADKNQNARQATLYEVWLEKALGHKRSSLWWHFVTTCKEFGLLLLLGGLVHARVFDALMSLFRYFAIHCLILELWRMWDRPEILIFMAFFVALPLPLMLRRHEPSNILVAFMLLRVFLCWAEKSILWAVRCFLRVWAFPNPDWPSLPSATEEEKQAKEDVARKDRNYNKVVEYLYVSFMTYELHLVRGLFILAINCAVQTVLVFVEACCGLHSHLLLNKHLGLTLGVLGGRKAFRPKISKDVWKPKPALPPPITRKKDSSLKRRGVASSGASSVDRQDSEAQATHRTSSFRRFFSRGLSSNLESASAGVSMEMSERRPSVTLRGPGTTQSFAPPPEGRTGDAVPSRASILQLGAAGRVHTTRTFFSREG